MPLELFFIYIMLPIGHMDWIGLNLENWTVCTSLFGYQQIAF